MSIYAKIEGDLVSNIIACDDANIFLMPGYYVKVTESTGTAAINGTYDSQNQKFIDPKPFESWILNSDFKWESPLGANPDILTNFWDEENQEWATRS